MCLFKKVIPNPVKAEHLSGFDKPYIKVACCKCPECRAQRSRDWIFRSYWEFLYNQKPSFFITLTYDDEHLPYYHGKPCFNREHVKLFIKRLRHKLGNLRYLIVPEYGGFFHRPHYHMILTGLENDFRDLDVYWHIRDTWYYGSMVDIQKMDSVQGSVLKAVSYVSEYVTKDPCFDLSDYEKDFPSIYDSRIQVSAGYGAQFLQVLTPDILKQGFFFLPIGNNGKNVKFAIPRYYELKMCYNYSYDPDSKKVELLKNQLGVEVSIARHNSHYSHLLEFLYSSKNSNLNVSNDVRDLIDKVLQKYNFSSFRALCESVYSDKGFNYYLYHRDFLTSFTEHCNSSLKYDEVFGDFYRVGSVLDDYVAFNDHALYFYNSLSQREEYGRNYGLFNDFMSIFDLYQNSVDSVTLHIKEEKAFNKYLRHMRNKLQKNPSLRRRVAVLKHAYNFSLDEKTNQYMFNFN